MKYWKLLPKTLLKRILLLKIHAFVEIQLIYVTAALKIPDYLNESGKNLEELARLTNTHEESLFRILRACTNVGLIEEKNNKYILSNLGIHLISDDSDSLNAVALLRGGDSNWKPWGELIHAVKTGGSPFKKVFGTDLFDYYNKHPDSGEVFNKSMKVFTSHEIPMILRKYDFSKFKRIIDVGGGNGSLLISIIERYNQCTGVLFDLPAVGLESEKYIAHSKVKEKIKIETGDMFLNIPDGGDCYILKRILHDWDDEKVTTILQNCRKSILNNGKLLIIDYIVTKKNYLAIMSDIQMMVVCPGGKERSLSDFGRLLNRSNFKLNRVTGNNGVSIIECLPITAAS